jgi:hypothetical protein
MSNDEKQAEIEQLEQRMKQVLSVVTVLVTTLYSTNNL